MTPATSSVLTSKKPLDAHEWLADTGAREAFYDELQDYLVRAVAQQLGQKISINKTVIICRPLRSRQSELMDTFFKII